METPAALSGNNKSKEKVLTVFDGAAVAKKENTKKRTKRAYWETEEHRQRSRLRHEGAVTEEEGTVVVGSDQPSRWHQAQVLKEAADAAAVAFWLKCLMFSNGVIMLNLKSSFA